MKSAEYMEFVNREVFKMIKFEIRGIASTKRCQMPFSDTKSVLELLQ